MLLIDLLVKFTEILDSFTVWLIALPPDRLDSRILTNSP
jgi:hypothetical protein